MLELKQKNYEDDYEEIIEVKRSIAYMLTILKRYKEAFDVWAEIKTNLAHNYGLIHTATLSAEYNMLYLLCARKEHDEAVKFQEKTTALFQNNEEYKKIPLITLYGSAICFLLRTGMKYNSIFESNPCESILSLFGQSKKKVTSDIYSKKSYRLHPEELIDKIEETCNLLKGKGYTSEAKYGLKQALQLAKTAWGDDNEKTCKIATRCQHI